MLDFKSLIQKIKIIIYLIELQQNYLCNQNQSFFFIQIEAFLGLKMQRKLLVMSVYKDIWEKKLLRPIRIQTINNIYYLNKNVFILSAVRHVFPCYVEQKVTSFNYYSLWIRVPDLRCPLQHKD